MVTFGVSTAVSKMTFSLRNATPQGDVSSYWLPRMTQFFGWSTIRKVFFLPPSVCKVTKTIHLYLKAVQIGQHFSPEFFVSRASFLWVSWVGSRGKGEFDNMFSYMKSSKRPCCGDGTKERGNRKHVPAH